MSALQADHLGVYKDQNQFVIEGYDIICSPAVQ